MASSPLRPHSFLIRYNKGGGIMDNKVNQQRDAPKTIFVVRGPLAIAFDDYVIDPTSRKRIGDIPVEVEVNNVIMEWLETNKLAEFIQPQEEEKE